MQKLAKSDLIAEVATTAGLSKAVAEQAVNATFEVIAAKMASGIAVPIPKFGTFSTSVRGERKGRNPQTKEEITIAAKTSPKFSAGTVLKAQVNHQ